MPIRGELKLNSGARKHRGASRKKLRLAVAGRIPRGETAEVLIHDLSISGMLIDTATSLAIGEDIEVDLPHTGTHLATIVWSSGQLFGCRFKEPLPPAAVSAALLRNPPARDRIHYAETISEGREYTRENLSKRITALRNQQGITPEELAQRLGVSRQSVWYWESGKSLPRPKLFKLLAKELGVTERQLLQDSVHSGPEDLATLIESSKMQIAGCLGIEPNQIRIAIEL